MSQMQIVRLYETGRVSPEWATEMLHRLTRASRAECMLFLSRMKYRG